MIIRVAGPEVETEYQKEYLHNPNSILISTLPGQLLCKRIFFLKWEPSKDESELRRSISDFMLTVVQSVKAHNYRSIAFPAIGCGEHNCSVNIVVETMVREIKRQLRNRKLSWTVKFVIEPEKQNVYDEFCTQIMVSDESKL
ncbi:unnamed protein product [Rotaria sp. Silwood2]|nr:unnamed protein product [Rotaria sp. Silwood2]CAF3483114.1 unnamed protein product [Rotaria sp. Silwood2]CAF4575133.1 unnamed protein product [Rotaria sp. Silwood2]